jgi:hypothetical protein
VLKAHHKIVGIADEIEEVMKVHVGEAVNRSCFLSLATLLRDSFSAV